MIGCDQKAVAAELVKKDPKTEEELKRIIEANQR